MIVLAILGGAILLATAVAIVWGITSSLRERDWLNVVMVGLIALCTVPLGILFIWLWADSKSPTFELKKSEWACTASHEETGLVTQKIGDSTVMMPTTDVVCDVYTRR